MPTEIVFADHCGQRRPNVHNCRPNGAPYPLFYTSHDHYDVPDEYNCECGRMWRRNARYPGGWDRALD